MSRPEEEIQNTYCTVDDINTIVPNIQEYFKTHFRGSPVEAQNYMTKCRKAAFDFINNNLEASELDTYALSNEKKWAEANYATFLILRGLVRGERAEQNSWIKMFQDEADKLLNQIIQKATSRKGLSSRTERFRRARWYFKDYGSDFNWPYGDKK